MNILIKKIEELLVFLSRRRMKRLATKITTREQEERKDSRLEKNPGNFITYIQRQ